MGNYGFWVFAVLMVLIQVWVFFGPPPTSDSVAAINALMAYTVFAGVAGLVERQRT